jgi:hypothetical protein
VEECHKSLKKTIPAADCASDHELLIATTRVKVKRSNDYRRMRSKLDLEHIPEEYKHAVGKGFETLVVRTRDPDKLWEEITRVITEAAVMIIPEKRNKKISKLPQNVP